jgi:hypothetical protein
MLENRVKPQQMGIITQGSHDNIFMKTAQKRNIILKYPLPLSSKQMAIVGRNLLA